MNLARRDCLVMLVAGAIAGRADATPSGGMEGDVRAFLRLRGDGAGGIAIGYLIGRYDGIVDDTPTSLFGVISATFTQYRPHPNGRQFVAFEQAFFTDLATGQVLDTWRNPYTGQVIPVPATFLTTKPTVIDRDLVFRPANASTPATFRQFGVKTFSSAEDVVFEERIDAEVKTPGGRPFRFMDTTVMVADALKLRRSTTAPVKSRTTYQALLGWRPWMGMSDRAGHLLGFGQGGYGVSVGALVPAWCTASRQARPEILDDPESILEPLWG